MAEMEFAANPENRSKNQINEMELLLPVTETSDFSLYLYLLLDSFMAKVKIAAAHRRSYAEMPSSTPTCLNVIDTHATANRLLSLKFCSHKDLVGHKRDKI